MTVLRKNRSRNVLPQHIQVHLIPSDLGLPLGGVGGSPQYRRLRALCNAIFAATGKRIRRLPIADQLKARRAGWTHRGAGRRCCRHRGVA